jgi:hypothetical protein
MNVKDDAEESESDDSEAEDVNKNLALENLNIKQIENNSSEVFTLSYNAPKSSSSDPSNKNTDEAVVVVTQNDIQNNILMPHIRRSSFLQFHKGILYLYGGKYEDQDEKEYTFKDMFFLNLKKLDEWKVLFEDKETEEELRKSEQRRNAEMEEYETSEDEKKDSDNESDDEDDDDDDDSEMEIDAPEVEPNETLDDYFKRTNEVWLTEAQNEFPDEKSNKILKKMAYELCNMFYSSVKQ